MLKKVLVLLSTLSILLLSVGIQNYAVNAQTGSDQEIVDGLKNRMTDFQKDQLNEFFKEGGKINDLSKKDLSLLNEKRLENKQISDFLKKHKNYTEKDINSSLSAYKFSINNDGENQFVITQYQAYEKNGKNIVTQTVYDSYSGEILYFDASKVDNGKAKTFFKVEKASDNDAQASKFKFGGKSFACSMVGLAACLSYCVVWHAVSGPGGLVCDVLCGTAMAAACSGS